MKTYDELLSKDETWESLVDYDYYPKGYFTQDITKNLNNFNLIDTVLEKFKLYKHCTNEWFMLIEESIFEDENIIETVFKINLTPILVPNYNNVMHIDMAFTRSDLRGTKIGNFMYRYLVDVLDYTLLSNGMQYQKARLLWASLSRTKEYCVDLIDIVTNNIIEKNIKIHRADDNDSDERVWSDDESKKHLRLILTRNIHVQ